MSLIPAEALESHIAILGKTGSGKSNVAKVLAERLMAAGERVCVVDPTGTWWGLRLRPDGTKSKYEPYIFGGDHCDTPIAEQHGAVIAEAIGTSSDSAIIDTRSMTVGQRTRFFTAFAETLMRVNRGPLHLIIDEAHIFMPQGKTDVQGGQMLHAGNNLVSLGRGLGLRIILISQRPQKLAKDSLTQAETLIAMRLIHNLDVDAVRAWIGEQADPLVGKELVGSLAGLPTGDAWVWTPQVNFLKRVHFPLASTFDSGKPPSRDEVAPTLSPINTAKLGEKMDSIRQEAMKNDPARLKARIAELEREKAKAAPVVDDEALSASWVEGYTKGVEEGFKSGSDAGIAAERQRLGKKVLDFAADFALATGELTQPIAPPKSIAAPKVHIAVKPTPIVAQKAAPVAAPQPIVAANGFTGPQMKVIGALALWKRLGHTAPTKAMVAMVAGYSQSSGGFGNLLSQLKTAGAINYPSSGRISLLYPAAEGLSGDEARDLLLGKLSAPQRKLFDAIVAGGQMTKVELGEATGYSPTSGGFGNLLSQLRTLGLIDYPVPGTIALEAWVSEIA